MRGPPTRRISTSPPFLHSRQACRWGLTDITRHVIGFHFREDPGVDMRVETAGNNAIILLLRCMEVAVYSKHRNAIRLVLFSVFTNVLANIPSQALCAGKSLGLLPRTVLRVHHSVHHRLWQLSTRDGQLQDPADHHVHPGQGLPLVNISARIGQSLTTRPDPFYFKKNMGFQ